MVTPFTLRLSFYLRAGYGPKEIQALDLYAEGTPGSNCPPQ